MTTEQQIKQKIIETLQSNNWQHIKYKDLNKEPEELILKEVFFEKIEQLNQDVELTEKDLQEVLNKLLNATRKEILKYLKEGIPVILEKYGYKKTLKLIDYDNIQNNSFIFSDEVIFRFADKEIMPDVVLFVNGIPIVAIEAENDEEDEWKKGFRQLVNYSKAIERLFRIIQIGVVVADNIYYFPFDEETFNKKADELEKKLYIWKPDEDRKTKDWNKIFDATVGFMLKPEVILKIIKYYTFYLKKHDIKILPRYYQFYTVEKLFNKFVDRLKGLSKEKSWTVWHYQGSGKSLTMVYLSYSILKRLNRKLAPEPVILIVVDRLELQRQIDERFFKSIDLDLGYTVKVINNLKELLIEVFGKGERANPGVYITTIQKFRSDTISEREEEIIDLEKLNIDEEIKEILQKSQLSQDVIEKISKKKDVFILIDEAHRSHYGKLNQILNKIFGSAFYVAFTGTPLLEKDKNTFNKFGKSIDTYFIDDAESDGYVLPIFYKPDYDIIKLTFDLLEEEYNLTKNEYEEILDEILQDKISENLDYLEELQLNEAIKRKLSNIKVLVFENDRRIAKVAKQIAEHFRKEVEPLGFKALVIVATRKAAIKYTHELKKLLGEDEVEAIITYEGSEDDRDVIEYRDYLIQKYGKGIKDYNELNEILKRKFQEEENPKILVVVNKLITGFDEPKIQTIYIDRFMSGHTLLQAIGRCNRRYDEKNKVNGLVVDFVGIIDRLKKALSLYFAEKSIQLDKSIVIKDTQIEDTLSNILEILNARVFSKIDRDFNKSFTKYKQYKEDKDVESIKNLVDELIALILEYGLDRQFKKLFDKFESTLFSPVVDEEIRKKYYSIYEFLLLIKLQLEAIESQKAKNIEDVKRIASIKAKEILEKIYRSTVIQEFLSSEKKELSEILTKISSRDYISILNLGELENLPHNKKEIKSRELLAKTVKTMVILKEREPTFKDMVDSILKKIQDYNRKKYKAYTILIEILPEIEKIQTFEDIRIKYNLDSHEFFIYKLLSSYIPNIDEKRLIEIVKKIRKKISEAEALRKRNDFCKILNQKIRVGVKITLRTIPKVDDEIIDKIIKELKEYFASIYKECEEELLG